MCGKQICLYFNGSNKGYETGRNGPFSQDKFAACGNDYQKGFMDGCLSVVGNDQEVCNLAEDAQ
jgi:hypothetical protein